MFKFSAYNPVIKVLPDTQGGGYKLELEISESEWENIKEINSPVNKGQQFTVTLSTGSENNLQSPQTTEE